MTTGTGPAPPRGWYYGWNIVAVCVLAQVAANGLTYNCMTLFLPDWSKQLHAPVSLLQLSIAGMVLVCAPLSPFAGQLADKYPPLSFHAGSFAAWAWRSASAHSASAWRA